MKLLFDQNLSPKLVTRLRDLFPDSAHVENSGLGTSDDEIVWEYARANGFAIVTKDVDYNHLSVLRGCPPKVIWLLLGNCTTSQVEQLIRASFAQIEEFERDHGVGTLALG